MAVSLAILSFICAAFLAVCISVQRIRTSVPRLAIILWLFGYNLVHGINALIWFGNVDIHVPVWCDIVTNFILGTNVALPAAFLCVSRELELLSSMRTISSHATVVRNRLILDIFICYLLPLLYILLHLVVQDHRFDLVENLGCSASADVSVVGFSLIWIPPFLICSISIVFFVLSIHNSSRHSSGRFAMHLESRSETMNSSCFVRCLVISMVTIIVASVVYLFCSFSGPAFHPWSWTAVHASMSEVNIVTSQDEITPIQIAWWGGFVITIVYLLLSFCLGEETRDIFKWIRKQAIRERHFILPLHLSSFSLPKMAPRSPSLSSRPSPYELKSGWDDMLDVKVPKAKKSSSSATVNRPTSITPTINTVGTEDEAFMTSTLSYLSSPTAKTLGLSGSPVSRSAFEMPPSLAPAVLEVTNNVVPAPPTSPLPSLPASCYVSRSRSRSPPASSSGERSGHQTLTPPHLRPPSI